MTCQANHWLQGRSARLLPVVAVVSLTALGCARNLATQQPRRIASARAWSDSAVVGSGTPLDHGGLGVATPQGSDSCRSVGYDAPSDSETLLPQQLLSPEDGASFYSGGRQSHVAQSPRPAAQNWSDALTRCGRQRIEYANGLGARGAFYSARRELVEVLKMVANACDTQRRTSIHGTALFSGLIALEEADDFLQVGWDGRGEMRNIAARHRTPILQGSQAEGVTPFEAAQRYCNAAVQDLALAGGGQPIAAEALHALGRLTELQHEMGLGIEGEGSLFAPQKMLVFYQSAVLVDPKNHRAANELGVLLVRFGQWERARASLEQSVAASRQPENCLNLAVVYEQLGEHEASSALRRHRGVDQAVVAEGPHAAATPHRRVSRVVRWVDPATMANQSRPAVDVSPQHP